MRSLAVVLVAWCAGCGAGAPTLTLGLIIQPAAIEFRGDDGDWLEPAQLAHSAASAIYELPSSDGVLAVACLRADGTFQVEELFATAGDFPALLYAGADPWPQLYCVSPPSGPLVGVTGEMLQGGQIHLGDAMFSGGGDWKFTGAVTTGSHDLVAVGQTAALIRHDQDFFAPVAELPIDLTDGASIVTLDLVQSDQEPVVGGVLTELVTVNGTVVTFGSATNTAFLIPPAQLETGDVQLVRVECDDGTHIQTATVFANSGTAPLIDQLELPEGIAYSPTAVAANWGPVGAVTTERVEYATQAGTLAATATKGWLAAHHTEEVAFDSTFPGFRWSIAPAASLHYFTVEARDSILVRDATVGDPSQ